MTLHEVMPPRPRARMMFTPDVGGSVQEPGRPDHVRRVAGKAGKILEVVRRNSRPTPSSRSCANAVSWNSRLEYPATD